MLQNKLSHFAIINKITDKYHRRMKMILKIILGIVIGGVLGYFYNKKIGCKSGNCPITSSKIGSIIYGMILGLMISSSF